jgi:dipeptidyl-peptidase-3
MKPIFYTILLIMSAMMAACTGGQKEANKEGAPFKWKTEQFADAKILRYQVPGFEDLTLKQKELIYYLSQAALCGRDITYDQNYRYNLVVRKTLESVYVNYQGDRNTEAFRNFVVYLKRVWFSNGIHHHYSTDKFFPEITQTYFDSLVRAVPSDSLPLETGQNLDQFVQFVTKVIFDPNVAPKRVSLDAGTDLIKQSACNFYDRVDRKEVETYYKSLRNTDEKAGKDTRISYGLNSKVTMVNGKVTELTWKEGGMYGPAISKIIFWLDKALTVAETSDQKTGLEKLISYYRTGDLVTWDDYNILWLKDLASNVDYVNGFIETYGDPLAMKATWESVVNFKNTEATKRTELIASKAQYFEDHSPVDPRFKKTEVKGVTAKVITVAQLGGDSDPTTAIGINLPNAEWIRKEHGSKSVTMENITYAYDQAASGDGFLQEFAYSQEEIDRVKKYGFLAGNLTTDMHECIGHAAGQLLPGTSPDAMKNYHSALEEARADLFALYYIMDPMLMELKLVPNEDLAKAEYDSYIRNGYMTQLVRIQPGKNVEQAHMRDRKLIATWVYEKGKVKNVIEKVTRDGKTYLKINDYLALRELFGKLLAEIQRIKSEGDYEAGRKLVETYGVIVDPALHKEMLERYRKLNIAPYAGFINPLLVPVMQDDTISDIRIQYPEDFTEQMLLYSKNYSFLPLNN